MKIFVTGATGVVGRRLVPLLLAAGHSVTAVVRSASKGIPFAKLGARAIQVDLFDPMSLRPALVGHDAIVNLATHMPPSTLRMLFPGAWRENDKVRRLISANLADAAIDKGIRRFIQESYAPAYPDSGDAWIDENTPLQPVSYNRTLLDAELSAQRVAEAGDDGVTLRFAAFYGPDANRIQDSMRIVQRGWSPLPGSPDAWFSTVSQSDAAAAVLAALHVPAGVYNVVDDEPLRRRDIGAIIAETLDLPPPRPLPDWFSVLTGPAGKMLSRSQRISNRKLRAVSDWRPQYPSLREGWPAAMDALATDTGDSNDTPLQSEETPS